MSNDTSTICFNAFFACTINNSNLNRLEPETYCSSPAQVVTVRMQPDATILSIQLEPGLPLLESSPSPPCILASGYFFSLCLTKWSDYFAWSDFTKAFPEPVLREWWSFIFEQARCKISSYLYSVINKTRIPFQGMKLNLWLFVRSLRRVNF